MPAPVGVAVLDPRMLPMGNTATTPDPTGRQTSVDIGGVEDRPLTVGRDRRLELREHGVAVEDQVARPEEEAIDRVEHAPQCVLNPLAMRIVNDATDRDAPRGEDNDEEHHELTQSINPNMRPAISVLKGS